MAPASQPPPAQHINSFTWQARAALEAGDVWQASRLLVPALAQGNHDALRLQATLLAQQGNAQEANALWVQLGDGEALLQAGQEHTRVGQLDKALAAYRAAYTVAPERTVYPMAHFLWSSNAQEKEAEQLLVEALRIYPNSRYSFTWYRELGALYQHQKSWPKAAAIYEQLASAAPDRYQDWIELGWVYYEWGEGTAAALTQFEQAIAIAPNAGAGYYAIATLLSREERFSEADPWYQQALELEPAQKWWYLSRAFTLQRAGNLSLALTVYATVQQLFPDFDQGHYQAAWAYRQAEQRENAIKAIEAATQLLSTQEQPSLTQAAFYARAGQIYEWAGQLQKALAAYEKAAEFDPLRQDVQDGLERLQ